MTDVTFKRFEDLPGAEGRFFFAAAALGVTAWGMNLLSLPPNWDDYPDHDHVEDAQEEVYVVLEGSAKLTAGDESWELSRGTIVRVGPKQKRKLHPGPEGVTVLAIGGTPGQAYEPPEWMKQHMS